MATGQEISATDPEFRALSWLNLLPFRLVEEERTFLDLTSWDGLPLWWIVHPYVSRDFLLLGRKLAGRGERVGEAGPALPSWPFKAASDPWLDLKLGLGDFRPGFRQRAVYALKAAAGERLLRGFYDRYVPAKWKLRKRAGDLNGFADAGSGTKPDVLALSHSRLWGNLGWGLRGDLVLETVIEELQARGHRVLGAEVDYDERGETASLRQRRQHGPWVAFEAFADRKAEESYREAQKSFSLAFDRLEKTPGFREAFRFEGVDLYPILRARVRLIFRNLLPHAVRLLEVARRMLEVLRPGAVLLAYETGPAGRVVSAAARELSVPTLAVQHGRIHPFHHHYAQCLGLEGSCPNPKERLLPDLTAVYGEKVAQVLARYGGYGTEHVAVTGQPRTDLIVRNARDFDRAAFLRSVGARPHVPVVLLATQNFPDVRDRLHVLEVVFGQAPVDWQVLIKPHPGERDGLVERFLRERGLAGVLVLRDAELYNCLAAADVVVTGTSTVGMEALLFAKPVVTVGGLPAPLDLAPAGAAIEVNSPGEFSEAVARLLRDEAYKSALLARAGQYVKEHFDGVDGRASARVADLIEARMRQTK